VSGRGQVARSEQVSAGWSWQYRLALVGLFAAGAVPVFALAVNHDVAYILYSAGRVLNGARLYTDIFDNNPPLIFWISSGPVLFARLLRISDITSFRVCLLLLTAGVLGLSWCFLRSLAPRPSPAHRCCLAAAVFLLVAFPLGDFGQREHIMLILLLPYLLGAVPRAAGRNPTWRLSVIAGALAGLGLALKPFFLPVWFGIEAYLTIFKRQGAPWKRLENVSLGLVLALYLTIIVLLTPEYGGAMKIAAQYYGALHSPFLNVLLSPGLFLSLASLVAFLAARPAAGDTELRRILVVATLCFSCGAGFQRKEWAYHYYPASATAVLLLIVIAVGRREKGEPVTRRPRWRAVLSTSLRGLGLNLLALICLLFLAGTLVHLRSPFYAFAGAAAAGLLLCVIAAILWAPPASEQRALRRASALGGLILAGLFALTGAHAYVAWREAGTAGSSLVVQLADIVKRHAPEGPILVLSTSDWPAFPVVNYTGARWSSRFAGYWPLPGIYRHVTPSAGPFPFHPREQVSRFERYLVDSVVADMMRDPPQLVVVDMSECKYLFRPARLTPCPEQFGHFDYLEYFSRDPRFRRLWAQYEFLADLGPFTDLGRFNGNGPYRIFRRRASPRPPASAPEAQERLDGV